MFLCVVFGFCTEQRTAFWKKGISFAPNAEPPFGEKELFKDWGNRTPAETDSARAVLLLDGCVIGRAARLCSSDWPAGSQVSRLLCPGSRRRPRAPPLWCRRGRRPRPYPCPPRCATTSESSRTCPAAPPPRSTALPGKARSWSWCFWRVGAGV